MDPKFKYHDPISEKNIRGKSGYIAVLKTNETLSPLVIRKNIGNLNEFRDSRPNPTLNPADLKSAWFYEVWDNKGIIIHQRSNQFRYKKQIPHAREVARSRAWRGLAKKISGFSDSDIGEEIIQTNVVNGKWRVTEGIVRYSDI